MAEAYILEVRNLNKTYSGIRVLHDIDFGLRRGETHALVGENGAGKSTLIKIIAGVVAPDEGSEIYWDGKCIPKMTAHKSIELGLSVIYQDISMFPNLSIAENICKGLYHDLFVNFKKIHAKAKQALEIMGVELDLSQKLGQISVGKQQLVAIARAITFDSKVIVMDEPTAALSSSEVGMLYRVIEILKERGISIIYISHKLEEIFTVADRITVLRDGYKIATDDVKNFTNESLINKMVGRELRFIPMRNGLGASDRVLFEVKDLRSTPMVNGVSFKVYKNEILGITGLVGAGRSEMAQTIFGLLPREAGELYIHGEKVTIKDTNDAIHKGICYLPEDRRTQGLFMGHTMTWNITAVTLPKHCTRGGLLSAKKELDTCNQFIDAVSIRPQLPQLFAQNLSGGNAQKVLFSRWMNADPKVLIVDEPTAGVDVGAKAEIHKILRSMAAQGVAVILISSDLPEVFAVSDRILVMREGRIVDETVTDEATQEGILEKGLIG